VQKSKEKTLEGWISEHSLSSFFFGGVRVAALGIELRALHLLEGT
jgi:hypothetical protein